MNDFRFYFGLGWGHILTPEALDHILFIAALAAIYMLKDWKQVLVLITAFTIGHTITLILSTKEWVTINDKLVEFLIPCTIVATAVTNLWQKDFSSKNFRVNYFLALFFGLVHGLAFANTLRMILASDQSFALSMVSFAAGLETAQILVVLLILLCCQFFVQAIKVERRHWVIFLSAAVFGLAVEMALQRWPKKKAAQSSNQTFLLKKNNGFVSTKTFLVTDNSALMGRQWRRSVQQQNNNESI